MIIIEFIKNFVLLICRFLLWLLTARDCEHCYWGYENWWRETRCLKNCEERDDCLKTIHRKHFKRKRGGIE